MPIRPENKHRYPKCWKVISYCLRTDRAHNRCESCHAVNGQPHPITGSKVVLTTAHLDHTPENCHPSNLAVWCQRCHNAYDAPVRRANRLKRLAAANGQRTLF